MRRSDRCTRRPSIRIIPLRNAALIGSVPVSSGHLFTWPPAEQRLLGSKGLGELTAVSVAPAIINAIYHATGKRIHELPVTVEKLL